MLVDFGGMSNSQLCALIDERIRGRNASRNREIIKVRLIDGLTYEAIAERFDMSVRQIKKVCYKGIDTISR